jgi:hypothetical protein
VIDAAIFIFVSLFVVMYIGRKVGWAISKSVLYAAPTLVAILLCLMWGGLIAVIIQLVLDFFRPTIVLALIFGYGMGAYVSVPNFGLFASVPPQAEGREMLIQIMPFLTYVTLSITFAFWPIL